MSSNEDTWPTFTNPNAPNPESKRKSMGIGEKGNPDIVFVRGFRWTLLSQKGLAEHFNKSVDFDFVKQFIFLKVYEVLDDQYQINVENWVNGGIDDDVLVFETFDGCGVSLYKRTFSGLTMMEDALSFDYGKSDISIREFKIHYNNSTFETKASYDNPTLENYESKSKVKYKVVVKSNCKFSGLPTEVEIMNRPQIEIEEVEVNHLNAKMWVPGKTRWKNLAMVVPQTSKNVADLLIKTDVSSMNIITFKDNQICEEWDIEEVRVDNHEVRNGKVIFKLAIDKVKYRNYDADPHLYGESPVKCC